MFTRLRLRLRTLTLWGLLAPLAVLLVALVLAVSTTTGLRLLTDGATTLALGFGVQLRFHGVEGRLLGPLRIDRIAALTPDGGVEIDALDLDWSLPQLLSGTLRVHQLNLARLRILPGGESSPRPPPARISVPLALVVEQLQIDRLVLAERSGQGSDLPLADALRGRLDSDGKTFHWQLAGRSPDGRVSADTRGRLDGTSGPRIQAMARVTARQGAQQVIVDAEAEGPLARLPLRLWLSAAPPLRGRGEGEVLLTPFSPVPVASLRLQLADVDPAFWLPAAGQATLAADIRLAPVGDGFAGPIRVDNATPGPLDRGRWPVRNLSAELHWQPGELSLEALDVALSAGRVQGDLHAELPAPPAKRAVPTPAATSETGTGADPGTPRAAPAPAPVPAAPPSPVKLRGRLAFADVDPAQLHGAARPARLRGDVEVTADAQTQRVHGQLSDPRFALRFDAEHGGSTLTLHHGLLSGAFGQARLAGALDLAGGRRFHVDAELDRVQPHRFARLPSMDLRGRVKAEGALQPAWQVRLDADLDGSRIEGKEVALHGTLGLDAARQLTADLVLTQAVNRLAIQGALGGPTDRLRLTLDAPQFAFPGMRLRGQGTVVLGGRLLRPFGDADLTIDELFLQAGNGWQLAGLHLQGKVPDGPGDLSLHAALDRLESDEKPLLRRATLTLQGSPDAHRLTASTEYLEGGRLALELAGSLHESAAAASAGPWRWQGQVLRTDLVPPANLPLAPFHLAAPATLSADPGGVALTDARLDSARGVVQLTALHWQSGIGLTRLEGEADAFAVAPFLPAAFATSDLEVGARWLYDRDAADRNHLRIERRRGDLRIETPQSLALGLTTLSVAADLTRSGRVALDARIIGARLGTAQASLSMLRDGNTLAIDRGAPWQGLVDWGLPDIAFLGPLLYPGARTAGQLGGVVEVAGSPQEPRFAGRVAGQAVELLLLDSGMQLVKGDIQLRLDQETLTIEAFRFADGARQPAPRDELRNLAGGGVGASGAIDLAARTGSLTIDIDRLGIMQRRDVWLRASGQARLDLHPRRLDLRGKARVDGAAFHLGRGFTNRRPTLSDDVVIVGQQPRSRGSLPLHVDFGIALGDACYLRMKEVESRLAGELRILSQPGNPARAIGSVRTDAGRFTAYGQELAIERGILNFQGPIDNPGLNILAMRRDQDVAAGVEVTGTALRPRLRLVSEPDVPDTDKLSWLILGRGTEQLGGNDPGLLGAAARALFSEVGGDGDGTLQNIQRRLGLSVSIREGQVGGPGQAPSSAIVGERNGSTAGGSTVVGVSTRLAKGVSFSLEQAVGVGEQLATISVELTRRLSFVLSAGVDHALDLRYGFDFGKRDPAPPSIAAEPPATADPAPPAADPAPPHAAARPASVPTAAPATSSPATPSRVP